MDGSTLEQQLTFELDGERFGIPVLAVQEIRSWEKATAVPGAAPHVLGCISLRGSIVSVMDLRVRLGIKACDPTPSTVVIVVRIAAEGRDAVTLGCVVDAVQDVVNIDARDVSPPPADCGAMATRFLRGIAPAEGGLLMLLDVARLTGTADEGNGRQAA